MSTVATHPHPVVLSPVPDREVVGVSAVVATYHGERFLREQLDSMLRQTRPLEEIVLVDDCSTDRTLLVAQEISRSAKVPIRILRNECNLGVSKNFERALRESRGEVVFLADQDDVWHAEKVARMMDEFDHRPSLQLLFTNARLIDDQGLPLGDELFPALHISEMERRMVRRGRAFDALLRRNLATGATLAVRRQAALRAMPFPSGWIHDEWIAIITAAYGQVDLLEAALIDYRQHDGNQIGGRRVTVRAAIDKMARSRGDFHRKLAIRTAQLFDKLRTMNPPIAADHMDAVRGKLRHATQRASLSPNHVARVPTIWRELVNGGYLHYSSGWRSVVRDILEPIRREYP